MLTAWGGCTGPTKPVFDPPSTTIAWPAPPAPPRIRYVGELRTSADLKARPSAAEVFGTVFAGRKPPQPLYGPRAVLCTPDASRVWIADPGGRCLHLFDLVGRKYRKVSHAGGQPFLTPVALTLGPDDSFYLADSERTAIDRLSTTDGRLLESLRLPDELHRPAALHYDAPSDELFVVDVVGHDVKVLARDGTLKRILGRRGEKPGEFNFPSAIAASDDRLLIADTGNHRVQAITRMGEPIVALGRAGDAPGDLALPKGVAVDADGHVYVVDGRFENVQIFDPQGRLLLFFGEEGGAPGQFWLPGGIFIEPSGRIWICDSYNRRLQVFQYVNDQQAQVDR
ncbi:MAG: hypothetical protein AABZ12_06630 [Planctomycetota bacterium]